MHLRDTEIGSQKANDKQVSQFGFLVCGSYIYAIVLTMGGSHLGAHP